MAKKPKLNPAQVKALTEKLFSESPKRAANMKKMGEAIAAKASAARVIGSTPRPSLNAVDLAGSVAKLAAEKDRLHEQRKKSPVKRPSRKA